MKERRYNVLLVEDQRMCKDLFAHYIESSELFRLEMSLANASVADIVCYSRPIDLVLMDVVTENGESGLKAAKLIKSKFPHIKIIIVTSMPEFSYIKRAKEIGVEGFWYKESKEDVLSIMSKVMEGGRVYPQETMPVQMGLSSSKEFTSRELEILRLMTGGYSNVEIAKKLSVSPGVIKNHVADMLMKTGFRSRTQLAVRAREMGLVILEKEEF